MGTAQKLQCQWVGKSSRFGFKCATGSAPSRAPSRRSRPAPHVSAATTPIRAEARNQRAVVLARFGSTPCATPPPVEAPLPFAGGLALASVRPPWPRQLVLAPAFAAAPTVQTRRCQRRWSMPVRPCRKADLVRRTWRRRWSVPVAENNGTFAVSITAVPSTRTVAETACASVARAGDDLNTLPQLAVATGSPALPIPIAPLWEPLAPRALEPCLVVAAAEAAVRGARPGKLGIHPSRPHCRSAWEWPLTMLDHQARIEFAEKQILLLDRRDLIENFLAHARFAVVAAVGGAGLGKSGVRRSQRKCPPPRGNAWEWPLTRLEKRARIMLIDQQVMRMERKELIGDFLAHTESIVQY